MMSTKRAQRQASSTMPTIMGADSICDATTAPACSMPQRGRLDIPGRSVVVTARLGATMVLQRLSLNTYKGVAAQLIANGTQEPGVRIVLRHADAAYSITLHESLPLEEAVAVWRGLSDTLCVPLLLTEEGGEDSIVRDMLGATLVRAVQPRKARGMANRRPRFSKRRGHR